MFIRQSVNVRCWLLFHVYILNLYNNSGWILVTPFYKWDLKSFIFSRSNCKASIWTLEFRALTLTAVWQCCMRLRGNIPSIHSCICHHGLCYHGWLHYKPLTSVGLLNTYVTSIRWKSFLPSLMKNRIYHFWVVAIAEGHNTQSHTSGFCLFSWRPGFFSSSRILTDWVPAMNSEVQHCVKLYLQYFKKLFDILGTGGFYCL